MAPLVKKVTRMDVQETFKRWNQPSVPRGHEEGGMGVKMKNGKMDPEGPSEPNQ